MGSTILDLALERHPAASIRPERFGALVYHYDNRRLMFLKSATLAEVVDRLADACDARSALVECGVDTTHHDRYGLALTRLMESEVVRVRGTT